MTLNSLYLSAPHAWAIILLFCAAVAGGAVSACILLLFRRQLFRGLLNDETIAKNTELKRQIQHANAQARYMERQATKYKALYTEQCERVSIAMASLTVANKKI